MPKIQQRPDSNSGEIEVLLDWQDLTFPYKTLPSYSDPWDHPFSGYEIDGSGYLEDMGPPNRVLSPSFLEHISGIFVNQSDDEPDTPIVAETECGDATYEQAEYPEYRCAHHPKGNRGRTVCYNNAVCAFAGRIKSRRPKTPFPRQKILLACGMCENDSEKNF